AVGAPARELLGNGGFSLVHPPRYGPLSEAELQPLLEGVDAVYASVDRYTSAILRSPEASRLKIISRWGV
ncbi:MAG: hydroxyacid dehydrogenase, partial [Verrucomicrobiota bacterium]